MYALANICHHRSKTEKISACHTAVSFRIQSPDTMYASSDRKVLQGRAYWVWRIQTSRGVFGTFSSSSSYSSLLFVLMMKSRRLLARKIRGYPKFAGQIGLRPEFAIFRRFGALNAENLLYLQAELVLLEKALEEQQAIDSQSIHLRKAKYALNWYHLKNSAENGDTVQLDLVLKIRRTLKQYSILRCSGLRGKSLTSG